MKNYAYISSLLLSLMLIPYLGVKAQTDSSRGDTSSVSQLRWRLQDHRYFDTRDDYSTIDLQDPSNMHLDVEYDPETGEYHFVQKVGDQTYGLPTTLTAEEYMRYQADKDEKNYWEKRARTLSLFTEKVELPTMYKDNSLFDRIFGGSKIDVRPQGNIDVSFGYKRNKTENPALPTRQQAYGIPDFDVQMNLGLIAKIGEKIKLNFNYNTKATFDFNNQMRLNYVGKPDEIIKSIDLGYTNFTLPTKLIRGSQSLFGIKTQMQFGRLTLTGVASRQRSQKQTLNIQGGAQRQEFELSAMDYDENRHFLFAKHFRDTYNETLSQFPVIRSQANINRIEVWITNKNATTLDTREVLAFMDLGEEQPYRTQYTIDTTQLPANSANSLYAELIRNESIRNTSQAITQLNAMGLEENKDFNKILARKLSPSEFSFDPQLGYLSLNQTLQPDQVLGIAFQYTYNGKVYQVGEFAQDVSPDTSSQKLVYLKMLKSTQLNTQIPLWDLMMKNVYNIGGFGITKDNFVLNVMYQKPGESYLRYLPEGPEKGNALIQVLNLDRLNNQGDPQPDGLFDFIEGRTIISKSGRVIFPVLEPFGEDLYDALGNDPDLIQKYTFQKLYDSTKFVAMQYSAQNRFYLQGSFLASSNSEIYLGGFNIPEGSVTIQAGSQTLIENIDYTIEYGIGKVTILNKNIATSGVPLNIQFDNNSTFGFQQQSLYGLRGDYFVNKNLNLGATFMTLNERPFTPKVDLGEDPINNSVLGADLNYTKESAGISKLLDKLPIYSTSAKSSLVAYGEFARLIPGHNRLINLEGDGSGGSVYIDNFEGTRSSFDLKFPFSSWSLASTPVNAKNDVSSDLFPEAKLNNDLEYNKNRARINWYFLDQDLVNGTANTPDHLRADKDELSMPYARLIKQTEVFPEKQTQAFSNNLQTFDVAYYPRERGPYNLSASEVDADGKLTNPEQRWGGLMRAINYNNFEASNIEYIEFWLLDPFSMSDPSNVGELYLDLGNMSEDILKDSRKSFENGLPYPEDPNRVVSSVWGDIPKNPQQLTNAFDNDPDARIAQDVGLDGLDDNKEKLLFDEYVKDIQNAYGTGSAAYKMAEPDPAGDNFRHFRDDYYSDNKLGILARYSQFNNPQGNSAVSNTANSNYTLSSTNIPDAEDLNRDNTLNESEEYFQYRLEIKPNMQVGENFIVSIQNSVVNNLPNNSSTTAKWYQFKIPIDAYDHKVGSISDFRSIRFMRMFMTGFSDTTVLRFARMDLTRSQWRKYDFNLDSVNNFVPVKPTPFVVGSVSLEENAKSEPVPYKIPPGIERQIQQAANGQNLQVNEQSLSLYACEMPPTESRSVFREFNYDMRQFKRLKMFVHAESVPDVPEIYDGDIEAFVRLGSDVSNNYYEYAIPLKVTLPFASTAEEIWPEVNEMNVLLDSFVQVKLARDKQGFSTTDEFVEVMPDGKKIKVRGVPNFAQVKNVLLGVRNTSTSSDKCAIVWFNELRLNEIIQTGGYAATGQVDLQLADLGKVSVSGTMHTAGYGNIDQKINERYQDNLNTYTLNTNINAGKLFPKNWGVQWPFFYSKNNITSTPKYDPYDKDVLFKDKVESAPNDSTRRAYKEAARTVEDITTLNMQGIKIVPEKKDGNKQRTPLSISNFDFGYTLTEINKSDPLLEKNDVKQQRLNLAYNYSYKPLYIYPLKKSLQKSKNTLLKDLNINLLPNAFNFGTEMFKQDGVTLVRDLGNDGLIIPTTYNKFFTWNRNYGMQWQLTESINLNYTATNLSRIDQPDGLIDTQEERDSVWSNIYSGGRNTNFNQSITASYTLPFKKVPVLSFMDSRVTYDGSYQFTASSLLAADQGNTIGNTSMINANSRFNFTQLYNRSKKLRKLLNPSSIETREAAARKKSRSQTGGNKSRPDKKSNTNPNDTTQVGNTNPSSSTAPTSQQESNEVDSVKQVIKSLNDSLKFDRMLPSEVDTLSKSEINKIKKEDKKIQKQIDKLERWLKQPTISKGKIILTRFLLMPNNLNVNYTRDESTMLPGYMRSTDYLGLSAQGMHPGIPFVLGQSPQKSWLLQQAYGGLISLDSFYVNFMGQTYQENFTANLGLTPFNNVRVDLNWLKTFSRSYSSLLKDTTYTGEDFAFLSLQEIGSFNATFVGTQSLLSRITDGSTIISPQFNTFMNNRKIIAERLSRANPYSDLQVSPEDPEYYKGYTRYAQDVLIPAFISAFKNEDPNQIPLLENHQGEVSQNPFRNYFPVPNWKVRVNQLNQWGGLSNTFTNLTINHGYSGTLAMNGLNSNLTYEDLYTYNYPSFLDTLTGNFVPYFFIPNVTISESFLPLIGIDATTKNDWNFAVEYKATNTESLSLIDLQLSENKSAEYSISVGKRWREVRPILGIKASRKWQGDINFSLALSYRNNKQSVFRLVDRTMLVSGGQKSFAVSPNMDYIINKNFTFRLYFDTRRISPHLQQSFPTSTTRGGVTLRYTFTQ